MTLKLNAKAGGSKQMAIICDRCYRDATPDKSKMLIRERSFGYKVLDLNGRICLCMDCYLTLSDFVRSSDFKKVITSSK